ncbi:helix-turn-helix transcriptional regulator [Bacillus cereus group sp. MG9]|uniref:helix-turn-helix transcriptional regulator n=1 Tax=Bacillus cereus group sp. MG9 TaxID=3040247 RepID=UPI0033989753
MDNNTENKIKELRIAKGWTQKSLAEKLDVSSQVISNWERAYTSPNQEDLIKLAKVFNVTIDYILSSDKIINLNYDIEKITEYVSSSMLKQDEKELMEKVKKHTKTNDITLFEQILENKLHIERLFDSNITLYFDNKKIDEKLKYKILKLISILIKE